MLNAGPIQTFGPDDRMRAPATIVRVLVAHGPHGLALVFEGETEARHIALPLSDWHEFRIRFDRLIAEYCGGDS